MINAYYATNINHQIDSDITTCELCKYLPVYTQKDMPKSKFHYKKNNNNRTLMTTVSVANVLYYFILYQFRVIRP